MIWKTVRECEFATLPRCRCRCEGALHGRGLDPTDPRVPAGDPHWQGYQLGLFPGLYVDPPDEDAPRPMSEWVQLSFSFAQ